MARNKPGKKSKPQPTFRQPAAAIALDAALPNAGRPPTPELEHLSDPELPSGPKKTVFEQTLDAMDPEELAALITECRTASLVPKETLEPAVLKRLERMKRQWEGFSARQGVPPELTFHETTFVDKGRAFIRMLVSSPASLTASLFTDVRLFLDVMFSSRSPKAAKPTVSWHTVPCRNGARR